LGAVGNLCGLPAVSVPSGLTAQKLPAGVVFVGRALDDAAPLAAARLFQKHPDWHRRPPPARRAAAGGAPTPARRSRGNSRARPPPRRGRGRRTRKPRAMGDPMTRFRSLMPLLAGLVCLAHGGFALAGDKPTIGTFNANGVKLAYFTQGQ